MRILHFISSRGFYGAESVVLQLSTALRERGHSVFVVLLQKPDVPPNPLSARLSEAGIEATVLPGGKADPAPIASLRRLLMRQRIDLLHTHNYKSNLYGLLAAHGLPVATVATCHNWTDSTAAVKLYGLFDRQLLRLFDRVAAVSDSTAARLGPAFPDSGTLLRIDNGIQLPPLSPYPPLYPSARLTGLSRGIRIGCVARLSQEKGVDLLLRAAAAVLEVAPEARFHIAGEGPERDRLLALRQELGLSEAVTFHGFQGDISKFLAGLDIFVQPSRVDAMPMSVLEAMAAGLPVAAPSLGGIPELLGYGARGLLFPAGDIAAMAGRILDLHRDPEKRKTLGKAAAAHVRVHCSAGTMARHYEDAYRQALGGQGSQAALPAAL